MMIKRKTLKKLPLQANYYPMTSALYIEDNEVRLTLVSAQPLGAASLKEGQLEVRWFFMYHVEFEVFLSQHS